MSATPWVPSLRLSGSVVSEPVGQGTWKMSAQGKLAWGGPGGLVSKCLRFIGIYFFLTVIADTALGVCGKTPVLSILYQDILCWSCFVVMDILWAAQESGVRKG